VWPAQGTVTSRFGARWGGFHNGLDIASRAWTKIYAARTGLVKEAGWCSGYGYCVKLVHDGGFETIYGHLIDQPTVSRGDEVSAGELIGYMGSTYDRAGGGYSTGVHLHLTVLLNGRAVDPLRFLP
jgi:murein DD-endopeptidase MepM/ murein hydrolase activator NlpD